MKRLLIGLLLFVSSEIYAQKPKFVKTAIVFVQKADSTWEPRMIQVGISDYDYTEVISGLKEGERVAQLSAILMQAKRNASNAQLSQAMGGNSPLGGATTTRPRN